MTRDTWFGLLAAMAAALIGSAWQITSRHGVTTTLGPLELATLRYAVPAIVLLPLWSRIGLFPRGLPVGRLAVMVVGGGLPFGLLALAGAQWAPAAHMGMFMAGSVPLFAALGAWQLERERIGLRRMTGLGLIVAGLFAFAASAGADGAGGSAWLGDLLFVAAGALWAAYTLAFRRCGLTPWQGTALVSVWSTVLLLPLLVAGMAPKLLSAPWTDVATQALGQGVIAGLLGLVTYLAAIARLGAARASLSAAPVPLITALGAAWLLGEPLSASLLLVGGLVMAGMALGAAR